MENSLLIVIASQDYDRANHKGLWRELSEHVDVIVANISADYLTTTLTGKTNRIIDAKQGAERITDRLYVFRPLFLIRPEVLPVFLFPLIARSFWRQIESFYPNVNHSLVYILTYDGRWVKILNKTRPDLVFAYYLYDEVRNDGKDNSVNKRRLMFDNIACSNSNVLFAMTKKLAENRSEYNLKKIIIGNGADCRDFDIEKKRMRIQRSVAFIGNFRDWIDLDLLFSLVEKRQDVLFCFVGSVENNMRPFFDDLLNKYINTMYLGSCAKDYMNDIYRMFDCVIIPYKNNDFVKATRPIKIVESVFAGTPVVTVPVDGYHACSFIRFAEGVEQFSNEIDVVFNTDLISDNIDEYHQFIDENTWRRKAEIIVEELESCRRFL